jgi:glycopeptide antibiotics resistance protein
LADKTTRLLTVLCFALGAGMFGFAAYAALNGALSSRSAVTAGLCSLLPLLLASALRARATASRPGKRRYMRVFLAFCCAFYALILVNRLLFPALAEQAVINIVPFKTMYSLIAGLFEGNADRFAVARFLFSNLLLFMPLGFLLPGLFRPIHKDGLFLLAVLPIAIGAQALRHSLGLGPFDVDEVLLNLCGAYLVFLVQKINAVQLLLFRACLVDKPPRR